MEKTLFSRASAVVVGDEANTVLRDVDILAVGPAIARIGTGLKDLPETAGGARVVDCRGAFVYPGLVNTHHHFFQAFVRNNATLDWTRLSVMEWIETIYRIFKLCTEESIYYASLVSMADLVKHGCTTAFDHQYCYPRRAGKFLADRQFDAARAIGLRYHAGRGANTLPPERGGTAPEEMVETTDEFLADVERLAAAFHDPRPFSAARVAAAPCQPVNAVPETFSECTALARRLGLRMHTHLGEGEDGAMVERYGERTLDWCEKKGFLGPDVWFAHGWDLRDGEMARIAAAGSGVAHCPAPAFLGGFPALDIPRLRALGAEVGFGVDGQASNDNSNLAETLRLAYLLQCREYPARVAAGRLDSLPSAAAFLRMACAGGAALLGRDDLGTLEEGKAADFFLIDADALETAGALHDPASLPARVGLGGPARMTVVGGRIIQENGRLAGIDEEDLARKARDCCRRTFYEEAAWKEGTSN